MDFAKPHATEGIAQGRLAPTRRFRNLSGFECLGAKLINPKPLALNPKPETL